MRRRLQLKGSHANSQLRKSIRNRGLLPNQDAAKKLRFMAIKNAKKNWNTSWARTRALAQLDILHRDIYHYNQGAFERMNRLMLAVTAAMNPSCGDLYSKVVDVAFLELGGHKGVQGQFLLEVDDDSSEPPPPDQ